METEQYIPIYNSDDGIILRTGQSSAFCFDVENIDDETRASLFITGETMLQYLWKNEPDYPTHYRTIEDALDNKNALEARYCLNLSNKPDIDYAKRVYKKIPWPPVLSYLQLHHLPDDYFFGSFIRASNLSIKQNGYLRMRLELYYKKENIHPLDVSREPDKIYAIDIPAGTYDWRELRIPVFIPGDNTVCTNIWIEGEGYEGNIWFERPFLNSSSGYNLLPDFTPSVPDKQAFDWSAQNISRKEWPEFRITLNNRCIFTGERFERSHCRSEWSVMLPIGLVTPYKNKIQIELISDYRDPLPYKIFEVGVITKPDKPFYIVSSPDSAPAYGLTHILIRTREPETNLVFENISNNLNPVSSTTFKHTGLNTLTIQCGKPALNVRFKLKSDTYYVECNIPRIIVKSDDGIITGTGDMIYIKQDEADFDEYLSWYLANKIGNMLTIRPTYRWSGSRKLNPDAWKYALRILNGMGIKYAHMVDGRELPGKSSNPTRALLSGAGFLGRQDHERDGAQFYWGQRTSNESPFIAQYYAMEQRIFREQPEQTNSGAAPENYFYNGKSIQQYRPENMPDDIKLAADFAINMLSGARHGNDRHTGPSVMFKYFYRAGYNWAGAETMYGSIEPIMAFLRGAAACYNKKSLGVHHAVQWSSSPHDTPDRYRRYRLALYVSYVQGATEINTEEGLWRIEEYYSHFHRFSEACRRHLQQQQDFYRYISTHSRKGTFYTPMALIHGNLDGWHAFGRDRPWGIWHAKDSDAEKSWDLLKIFYPLSKPGETLYIHGCPSEPVGYYTGTPYGNIDVIPVESGMELLSKYKVLAFMGYNYANENDCDRLLEYVNAGGHLVLGWAHLIKTTSLTDIAEYRHTYINHQLTRELGEPPVFVTKHNDRGNIDVNAGKLSAGKIRVRTNDGTPIVIDIPVGKGIITLFNVLKYPAADEVRIFYEDTLKNISMSLIVQESAFIECSVDIGYAIYDLPNERHIYVLAVDWYNDPSIIRNAVLIINGVRIPVEIPFGVLYKIVINENSAAYATTEDGEVLCVNNDYATVQGAGLINFVLIKDGKKRCESIDFSNSPIQKINLG